MDPTQNPRKGPDVCISGSSTNAFSTPVGALSVNSQISLNPVNLPSAGQPDTSDNTPYHVFTRKRKWLLVYIISLAATFSPLSSNIYFPAINTIAKDLHTNTSLVALTVTVYMVVQGIAPSFWGPWSDIYGRRVIFIGTLAVYASANLALAFTVNYPMLLVLRGVQAAGSAATISIATGVIADIAKPSESM